jgi:endonuclease/exonuclease/phosphatase family metal-dependent hydrolase
MAAQATPAWPLAKESASDIRVMTFNVGFNSLFPRWEVDSGQRYDRSAKIGRILRAIGPDVICFNEVLPPRTRVHVGILLDSILPIAGGAHWRTHSTFDNVIAARYPLVQRAGFLADFGTPGQRAHAMALVDLPDEVSSVDLYLICAHFQSREGEVNVAARERQADAITRWIRDAKAPGGEVTIQPGTAIVVLGDMTAYAAGPRRHLESLIAGRLIHDGDGAATAPDWDGSPLVDALPPHNGRGPETYTYRDPEFPPGALDRILYTGSVLEGRRRFVLFTPGLSESERAATGLQPDDGLLDPARGVFDHFPVVIDFRLRPGRGQ